MEMELWLPAGFSFIDSTRNAGLLYSGSEWQIYKTDCDNSVLVVTKHLLDRWIDGNIVTQGLFTEIDFGNRELFQYCSKVGYELAPVVASKSPNSKTEALAFAVALHETRAIDKVSSFHDSIYVEHLARLLPTWSLTEALSDDLVFGTWLTGGVHISVFTFERIYSLLGWMSPNHVRDVLITAGFEAPNDGVAEHIRREGTAIVGTGHRVDKKRFSLPGRPNLERFFYDHVLDILDHPQQYKLMGIEFPAPIILHGPPGCGKTFAVERLVEHLDWPCFSINSNSVGSPYIHDTSKKISGVFDQALASSPSVVIIDEMEAFLSSRDSDLSAGLHHIEEVSEFLRRIPEAASNQVLIIAMTNLLELVDPAILRRGRFDHIVEVTMPDRQEVKALIDALLGALPVASDVDPTPLLDELTNKPLSDTAFVIREAGRISAKNSRPAIDQESLLVALDCFKNSTRKPPLRNRIGFE